MREADVLLVRDQPHRGKARAHRFDQLRQKEILESFITQKVDGIAIVVPDQKIGPQVIDMAKQAKIPLVASDDPIIFFEPKRRYWEKGEVADTPSIGLHASQVVRPGADVTVAAYGPMVRTSLDAAIAAAEDGRDIEVIDMRSLSPLDMGPVYDSVRKTGRLVGVNRETVARYGRKAGEHASALHDELVAASPSHP